MSLITIPFGTLAPDLPHFRLNGEVVARNLVLLDGGAYGPMQKIDVHSGNELAGVFWGFTSARTQNGTLYTYAGVPTKLYKGTDLSTWADSSKVGGYSLADPNVWEFAVWNRNNKIIATNFNDAVQSVNNTTGAVTFADMITSTLKPKARHIGIINNFVVLGNTNDATDGDRPWRVWWSAFGDETDFDPDAATQCDYEDLATGGPVQAIVGGNDYGLIFQRDQVQTMRYVGGSTIFEFYPLNYAPGTPIPNSVIAHQGRVFYISASGFVSINGGQVEHIGTARVDRRFWDSLFHLSKARRVSAAIDPVNKTVAWCFASKNPPDTVKSDYALLYKWDDKRWVEWSLEASDIGTLTGISRFASPVEVHGRDRISVFGGDSTPNLMFFNGAPTVAGTIETGDLQPADGRRWQINGVQIIGNRARANIASAPRNTLNGVVTYGTAVARNQEGFNPLRTEGRFQRLRCSLTSCFSGTTSSSQTTSYSLGIYQGLLIDYELEGER